MNQQVVDEAMVVIKKCIKDNSEHMTKKEKAILYSEVEDHMLQLDTDLEFEEDDDDEENPAEDDS